LSGELELWVSRSNLPLTLVILNPRRLSIFWHGLQARMARVLVFESQGAKGGKGGVVGFVQILEEGFRIKTHQALTGGYWLWKAGCLIWAGVAFIY